MEVFDGLIQGLGVATQPMNLLYCVIGVFVGTAVGVLPGLGPTATISLLLPVTFRLDPTGSIIMLAGIYYGAMYGGSITAILFRIPGEAASIVTCMDGHAMARQGRAGAALGISTFGSFIAGVATALGIAVLGPFVAGVANQFGPAEYAALVLLGMVLITQVSGEQSFARAIIMIGVGFLASTIGRDMIAGSQRFTFGTRYLEDGINIALIAMGMFGVAEVLVLAERHVKGGGFRAPPGRLRDLLPTRQDWSESGWPIARGTVLGFFLGLLPGGGAMIASFASYVMEKRLSRTPEKFGQGAIAGVAGPETANNAAAQGTFVPLLSLGIPSNVVLGVILGALLIHGIPTGPTLITNHPELFWGVIASMLVGNTLLVILNLPLLPIFVALLRIPQPILLPLILLFCVVGAFSLNNNVMDAIVMSALGIAGYLLRKGGFDAAPLILAYVLGPLFERSVRQALLIGYGSPMIFITKPIAAAFVVASVLVLLIPYVRRRFWPPRLTE
ncbi:MAG: tripartite tricarboxylate transporter permease [Betaproteobacteria bacterium]|nr:tripartite tricarboxylate transporter permease [Betaproteobacteria bacterium]